MKLIAIVGFAAAGAVVAAHSHRPHARHHVDKRGEVTQTVSVPGPTVYEFKLGDQIVGEQEACAGIEDGKFELVGGYAKNVCASKQAPKPTEHMAEKEKATTSAAPATHSTSTPPPPPPTTSAKPTSVKPSSTKSSSTKPSSTSAASQETSKAPVAESKEEIGGSFGGSIGGSIGGSLGGSFGGSAGGSSSGSKGIEAEFPSGEIDCEDFPHEYGPIALEYLGLGGWTGVQSNGFANIVTGKKCDEGSFCSYACPAGYQKSQWPQEQGTTGQSVGGIQCKNGKLHLTNPDLSKKLCVRGVGGVKAKNTMSEQVAVCRTDYPGTESETVPLQLAPNAEEQVTCPDGNSYYHWTGKSTSAQYYVNPKGVPASKACRWGFAGSLIGNFAPLNLGVGQTDSGKWLSVFHNMPTVNANLNYNVEIKGDDLSGTCKYANGQFEGSAATGSGCTVKVNSGDATFVFSE